MYLIRKLVTKDKNRLINDEFNLDLTYITPWLIAMSFPSSGIESFYRNPISEV